MSTQAQIIANRCLRRRIVLNLGHFDFEIVSDFDIRISDFNHSGCFMQNKPNFLDAQMNTSSFITKYYENERLADAAKTNPIKPNFRRARMNINSLITKDYRKKDDFAVQKNEPNSKPICWMLK